MCKPGSKRCSGNALETCSGDGQSWGQARACGISCDAAALTCKDAIECSPPCNGSPHCMGAGSIVTEACDRTRGQCVSTTKETCGGGKTCQNNSCACSPNAGQSCSQDACNPGTWDCSGKVCNTTRKDCGARVCSQGNCVCPSNQVPGPGTSCCNANYGRDCNQGTCNPGKYDCNGTCAGKPLPCGSGQVCSDGRCGCGPGTAECDGKCQNSNRTLCVPNSTTSNGPARTLCEALHASWNDCSKPALQAACVSNKTENWLYYQKYNFSGAGSDKVSGSFDRHCCGANNGACF
jgi:hypothetical protein